MRDPSTTPVTLYHLRDANFNVVGLADEDGRLVARYGYTPYGRPRWVQLVATALPNGPPGAPSLAALVAAKANRIGHQGLPIERFDAPWESPMGTNTAGTSGASVDLIGNTCEFVYHSRNRLYSPQMGRFLARDPNGLGLPVLESLAYGGMALSALGIAPDVMTHFGDGMNTHGAYGLSPFMRTDPTGLFTLPQVGAAMGVQGLIGGLIGGYLNRNGPGGMLLGFGLGATAGAMGAAAGFGAVAAFGASASGLYAVIAGGAVAGGVQAGVHGFGESYYFRASSIQTAIADAAWNSMLGTVFGGVGGAIGYGIAGVWRALGPQQADDIIASVASAGTARGVFQTAIDSALDESSMRIRGVVLSKAGKDLLGHGEMIGLQNVQTALRSDGNAINAAAERVVRRCPANIANARRLPSGDVDIPLYGAREGLGMRLNADGTFKHFLGNPGSNN